MAGIDTNIFREYDIRGIVGRQLTDETVAVIGKAIGTYLRQHGAKRIAIGYDARESSPGFCKILTESLHATGCDTVQIGMVPTPVLYHTLFTTDVDGGVMITGSHNPPDHNGFKISLGTASLFGDQIREIRDIVLSGNFTTGTGIDEQVSVLDEYKTDLISRVNMGNRRLKVVIDAGNGMGGITAVPVYQALGTDVFGLYTDPDPTFPNHHPDPSITENLTDLIDTVRKENADLGIAFDGDADRITVVDETGRVIWGDELMIVLSRSVLATHPGGVVIAEAKCSQTLFDDIKNHGGVPLMWKAGHSIIKAKMKETGAVLAGEMSGHIFFADRFYGFDDAAYAGARVMEILSKTDQPLSAMLADLPKTFSTPELRINCPDEIKFDVVQKIADHFSHDHKVITIDGARIVFNHGWGIVRASNTQAILVLRFEADSQERLDEIRNAVESSVEVIIAQLKIR
ncbi:MAG: phosphomannomutase/phosphoglucomutase [Chloracidobacterium sp.]|nr:phosphomannomutase/phosphoglucomutase [Chloracidobacterium sp.]